MEIMLPPVDEDCVAVKRLRVECDAPHVTGWLSLHGRLRTDYAPILEIVHPLLRKR